MSDTNEHQASPGIPASQVQRRLIPLTEWPKIHSWPPIGGLRYLVFHGKENGFSAVIRKIGRRVLIDEQKFFEWADRQEVAP